MQENNGFGSGKRGNLLLFMLWSIGASIRCNAHWQFGRIEAFCQRFVTRKEDVMTILGDAGINFSGRIRDRMKEEVLDALPITIFAIHGNHE